MRLYWQQLFHKPEDGTGGGAAADQGDGGGEAGDAGAGAGGTGGAAGLLAGGKGDDGDAGGDGDVDDGAAKDDAGDGAKRPDHVPEKFFDATTGDIKADELAKAYSTLEAAHSRLKQDKGVADRPETDEAYLADGFEMPEGADRLDPIDVDDPVLKGFAKIAHEEGLSVKQFRNISSKFLGLANEQLPVPLDMEAEKAKLGPTADQQINGLKQWVDSAGLTDEELDFAYHFGASAVGIRTLAKMRQNGSLKPIPLGAPIAEGGMSKDEWYDEVGKAIEAGDTKRRAELDKIGEGLFGTHAAGSSADI
jgi:hypothetical protein